MASHGSTSFSRRHCHYPRVGQISADGLELALPISTSSCWRHGVSSPLDATDSLESAKHFSGELLAMASSWPCISCGEAAEGAQYTQLCNRIFHKCLKQAKQRYQLRCISFILHPILPLQFPYRLHLNSHTLI
jgi:hypothetical protein